MSCSLPPLPFFIFACMARTEDALSALRNISEELRDTLEKTEAEKQSERLQMCAEIDDLSRTKSTLEERLIELLKYAPG